jgi:hypothetical protein
MPSAQRAAIEAVAEAWTNPGISPEYHAEWQARLSKPSEEGGWPVLHRAIMQCVSLVQEAKQGKNKH